MTPQLRSMLALLAVLGAGGTAVAVYTIASGSDVAVVKNLARDGGCVLRDVTCTFFADGGYSERTFRAARCPNDDAGPPEWIVPPALAPFVFNVAACRRAPSACTTCDGGNIDYGSVDEAPPQAGSCACFAYDGGNCTRADGGAWPRNPDGGLWNNQMQPSEFAGADCLPLPCGEKAGIQNWRGDCVPE